MKRCMKRRHGLADTALLHAAVVLIREAESPRAITVRRIVESANTNLNAVNYHFGSKEALIRGAVRVIISDYFEASRITPGSTGPELLPSLVRICDFLFDEPVAAALALSSELEAGGGGGLTRETMDALAGMLLSADPSLPDAVVRLRAWTITAAIHQFVLRPQACSEWLLADPRDKVARDALLAQLCALASVPAPSGTSAS